MVVVINVLTGIMIFISFLLIGIILIQEDKSGDGIGMIGGSSQSFLGASSANVLTRITTVLVVLFFVLSIVIGSVSAEATKVSTINDTDISLNEFEGIFDEYIENEDESKSTFIPLKSSPEVILVQDFESYLLSKLETEIEKTEILEYYEKNKNGLHYNLTKKGIENKGRVLEILNKVEFSLEAKATIITQ